MRSALAVLRRKAEPSRTFAEALLRASARAMLVCAVMAVAAGTLAARASAETPAVIRVHVQANGYEWPGVLAGAVYVWHETGLAFTVDQAADVHGPQAVGAIVVTVDTAEALAACGAFEAVPACASPGNVWLDPARMPVSFSERVNEAAHELGHALGLDGPAESLPALAGYDEWGHRPIGTGSVMTAFRLGCEACQAPDTLDLDTVRGLYGLPPVPPAPATPILDAEGPGSDSYEARLCVALALAKPWLELACVA